MSKVLALDVGEKRIGIAKSDDSRTFVFPVTTLDIQKNPPSDLQEIIDRENPDKIIVGLPRNMDGTLGFQAEKVQEFVRKHLEQRRGIVEYEDESVTSIEAEKEMKKEGKDPRKQKDEIDSYAAKIILESWIRRQQ